MRNILAIAGKELRGYFASPIAYIVIGAFALLFGYFFYAGVAFFNRQSMQMAMGQGGTMNINQMLVTPVFINATVMMLFLLPAITMRTYAEEKRSGTIELLLTSPVTDTEIILGKFLGAMGLYAAMLAVTLIHISVALLVRQSGMEADRERVSRDAADGRLFHCSRAADFQPDQKPDRRWRGHVCRVPDALGDQLDRRLRRTDRAGRSCRTCRSPITSTTSRAACSIRSIWSIT